MQFGRYEIIRELGKGAMGIVYLAKDPVIGRLVALKTLRAGIHADEDDIKEFQERFTREAQAAGILTHPGIVMVYDIGTSEEGESFIAMEYAEGANLKEIMMQGRPIAFDDLALSMAQVAEGLDFAHERGIVHRDVKPANIIIRDNTNAKITDFGIAKLASSVANLTMTGQFLGTPNYMAPEQVRGQGVDGRSDIFSLGVCLYEALTKEKPFAGDSLTTISYKIVHERFTPPTQIDGRIPAEFDEIVARCLAKEPENRYQRAIHLGADLRALAAGRTISDSIMIAEDPGVDPGDETVLAGDPALVPTVEVAVPTVEQGLGIDEAGQTRPRLASINEIVPEQLRENVPNSLFWSIVGGIVAAVLLTAVAIGAQRADIPDRDLDRERVVKNQLRLKSEGEELLAAGNIEGAYQRYFELRQLAPNSPEVGRRLRSLETIRAARMSYDQRQSEAQLELARGKELFAIEEFADAVPFFENAFSLDPELSAAINYLQMSRDKIEQKENSERRAAERNTPPSEKGSSASTTTRAAGESPASTATLQTYMVSNVSDGYITVSVDEVTLVHENLWRETWGFLKRRTPQNVNTTTPIPTDAKQIEVWVVIQSQQVRERQVLGLPTLEPGVLYRLKISFDPKSKSLHLQLI